MELHHVQTKLILYKVSCHLSSIRFLFVLVSLIRYVTILFYLNDVEEGGETAFPMADNVTLSMEVRFSRGVSLLEWNAINIQISPRQHSSSHKSIKNTSIKGCYLLRASKKLQSQSLLQKTIIFRATIRCTIRLRNQLRRSNMSFVFNSI